ncbi:MAG TPA: hypothetical protein VHO25_03870 [Polyangiaceae bacterium]|nr:hypothetical protein [Polyangiaceae bacterium]
MISRLAPAHIWGALICTSLSLSDLAAAQKVGSREDRAQRQELQRRPARPLPARPKKPSDGEPPARFILGLSGGYGKLDAYHSYYDEEHLGTFGAAAMGLSLGVAGFPDPHLQLAGELVVFGQVGTSEIARYEPTYASAGQQPGDFSFTTVMPFGGRIAAYFQKYRGPFLSFGFHGGFSFQGYHSDGLTFGGAYCGELGYAVLNVLAHTRLSLAVGYQATGSTTVDINGDDAYITAQYPMVTLRLEP